MPHQEHNIPWPKLDEIITIREDNDQPEITDWNALWHFARCMFSAIEEFADTPQKAQIVQKTKWNDTRKRTTTITFGSSTCCNDPLDPSKWSGNLCGGGGCLGYLTSLICGYIQLNLLLFNRKKYAKNWGNNKNDWVFNVCSGRYDGHHPPHLAEPFRKLFDQNGELIEFNQEVAQQMIDQCKVYFKCLYTYHRNAKNKPHNPHLSAGWIIEDFEWLFGVWDPERFS